MPKVDQLVNNFDVYEDAVDYIGIAEVEFPELAWLVEISIHAPLTGGDKTGSMVVLPCGTKVQNYGYYTEVNGVKWLYIQVTYQGVKYTGFSSGQYLSKI